MRTSIRSLAALSAAAALVATYTGIAHADQVANSVDGSVDAIAEIMPLNLGADGTTSLYYIGTSTDSKPGCNLTGPGSQLTVTLASSDAGVATVSPSTVTLTSCGDSQTITVHPVAGGSTDITATFSSAVASDSGSAAASDFDLAPASFTVNVTAPVNHAPTVSISGVSGGANYNKGSVPAAQCDVTDDEDGPTSFPATLSAITGDYASDGIGSQTASCSYTDAGGLTASGSVTYNIKDPTAPSVTYTLNPTDADGSNGWYKSPVTLTWTVSDPDSTVTTVGCHDQSITADQVEATYSCTATSAGGTTGPISVTIKKDGTVAVVACDAAPTTWQGDNITLGCTANDPTSGLADASDASFSLSTTVADGSETATALTGSRTVLDNAGNSTTAGPFTAKVDRKAPVVTAGAGSCATPGNLGWCKGPVSVTFTSTDGGSGLADATQATIVASTVGDGAALTVSSGNVADNVGHIGSATAGPFKVDATAPAVPTFGAGPVDGAYYFPTTAPATPDCTSSDATSGLASCLVTDSLASYNSVGTHTLTATATDVAGNTSTATLTYYVYTLTLNGFFQPVDMNGVLNTVKNGSTVPLKFRVFDRTVERTDTAVVTAFGAKQYTCGGTAPEDAVEMTTTGGTSLRYDTTGTQFIQNWQTPRSPGTCWVATATFVDGSKLSALFKLK
jgi:hypothetical protein